MSHPDHWYAPPHFPDEEFTRASRWLYFLLLLTVGALMLTAIPRLFAPATDVSGVALFQLVLLLALGGIWVLMRRGYVPLASALYIATLYLGTVFTLLFVVHTIRDATTVGFFLLVSGAGLLFPRPLARFLVGLTVVTLSALYVMEATGAFAMVTPAAARADTPWLVLVGLLLNAVLAMTVRELEVNWASMRRTRDQLAHRVTAGAALLAQVSQQLAREVSQRRQSELHFRALAETSHDFVCIWDGQAHRWRYCSRDHFLGHASLELLTEPAFWARVHPDDFDQVRGRWLQVGPEATQLEYRLCNAQGEWEWVHVHQRALARDDDGNPAQILVSISLITDRKHEETLRLALQNAEIATRAKSEFLANMSHEIRTPLNGVVGMTSLLETTELNEAQRFYVDTIRHSSDTLLTILNDILDLSKAESGGIGLEHKPVNLYRAVEEVLDILAPKAAEKGLELVYSITRAVPGIVLADAARLRQVLLKITANAVKFTPQGEVSITVDAKSLDDGQLEIHFAVRDTGIGITPEQLEQLFQPFSQVDASNTRFYGGAGLGLAISRRLCNLMGGNIWAESEQHAGSTFHFTIVAQAAEPNEAQSLFGSHPLLDRRAVLVVDDNQTVRQSLQTAMRMWGMRPSAVATGAEALTLARTHTRFDVAVIDMQMPGMSGLTLAKELRKLDANLPIVLMSALGAPMYAAGANPLDDLPIVISPATSPHEQREVIRQLSVKNLVFKPIKLSVLRSALLDHLEATLPGGAGDDAAARGRAPKRSEPDMGRRHPQQILLVEDNRVNQKVALHMLKRLGYEADVAANGVEALQAVHARTYDVVLMDVQMPEMDGLEATRRIRAEIPAHEQPYIIAITAAAMQLDRQKCLEAGMNDFLAKPVHLEDLVQALKQRLPVSTVPVD